MSKIEREEPCPCGSGEKYKNCCINKNSTKKTQIISSSLGEYRIVPVGNSIYIDENTITFPDFLTRYIMTKLGKDFGETELAKPIRRRHPIMRIYNSICETQKNRGIDEKVLCIADSGLEAYWYHFGYNLFLLDSQLNLQNSLIKRLRRAHLFQGARYELFVAAVLIEAGLAIDYAYDSEFGRKIPEFDVQLNETTAIAVEAKSKHRYGVLGFKQNNNSVDTKTGLKNTINKARNKNVNKPYFIFIDINLPPSAVNLEEKTWKSDIDHTIRKIHDNAIKKQKCFPVNCYFFTNCPHHYIEGTYNAQDIIYSKEILIPCFELPDLGQIIDKIIVSFKSVIEIPNFFNEN